jgi:hypothetical protein
MTRSNSLVTVIPLEVILLRIIQQCLCEGNACELAISGASFYYLHAFRLKRLHRGLAVKTIARAFDIELKDIRHALEKSETIPKGRG